MKTQREIEIDAYIKDHPRAKLPAPLAIVYHGKVNPEDVFRLPTKLLIFNIANGRFAAEMIEEERKLRRKLDPLKPDDAKIIRRFLLEQNEAETKALTDDLKANGQLDPGIITSDGAVINANRRMSILQTLYDETGKERYAYLNVARLPRGVDAKDLWKIEAKLQFGRDFRLEYGPINELLKIRAGKLSGLSDKQISDALGGRYSPKQVEEKLRILKLIDSYLISIGKRGEYKVIQEERIVEKFNSLHSSVVVPLAKGPHKTEVPKITQIAFGMIKGGKHSHWKIRELRKISEVPGAKKALLTAYDKNGKLSTTQKVADAFDSASYIVEAQEQKDRPEKLAGNALSALSEIDSAHEAIAKQDFKTLLGEIQTEVTRLVKAGASKRGKRR
jgi:hypothetical protein